MPILALVNQKGGVSKSTTSVHLAYWLHRCNKQAVLVDADAQRSSSLWLEGMDNAPPYRVIASPDDLLEQLPDVADEFEFVVVDAPAGLAEETRAILFSADVAIVPVQPTGVDLRSAGDALRLIKQAQRVRGGAPQAVMFLARAVKGTRLKDEAIELLASIEAATLLDTVVHQRQVIADTSGQSCTVWDLGKAGDASASEFDTLFREVMEKL